jgi:hypothetical protein
MSDGYQARIDRIRKLLSDLGASSGGPNGFQAVLIEGALPREPGHAEAGAHTWTREPDESLEGFVKRCVAEARALGERLLVIGGLAGPMPETLEEFLAGLHFDEVPPIEAPGIAPGR